MSFITDMRTWTYAQHGGLLYPVVQGDTWCVTAQPPHMVSCQDVLNTGPGYWGGASLFFTDPPWTDFLVTQCYKQVGARPRSLLDIHRRLLHLAKHNAATIYIECARDGIGPLVTLAEQKGAKIVAALPIRSGPDDGAVMGASFNTSSPTIPDELLVGDGAILCAAVLRGALESGLIQKGETVADPMCGTGKTAKVALGLGLRFVGGDINPRCCSATLATLHRATGEEPHRA